LVGVSAASFISGGRRRGNYALLQLRTLHLSGRPPKAISVTASFDDVRAISNVVEQALAQYQVRNHLRPFRVKRAESSLCTQTVTPDRAYWATP
ncbi:MAG TPA: hypothetical protein VMF50_05555, partial [Candidatus Binataceae bacterium]|nr:hypothetical protein [Candidatus Binataceae bacterium]